jgi:hypothetical protein
MRTSELLAVSMLVLALAACSDGGGPPAAVGDQDAGADAEDAGRDTVVEDAQGDVAPEVEDCQCPEGEVCVSNETVDEVCFPRDCEDARCDADEVCSGDACVPLVCAGVECGGYPMICRAGECVRGSCESDPDVQCPEGTDCIDDTCLPQCAGQDECSPLACVDGHCQVCDLDADCGPDLICVAEQCIVPCTEDDRCEDGDVCDPDSGRCTDPCADDDDCESTDICDLDTGLCGPPECLMEGQRGECDPGMACLMGRCTWVSPDWLGGLCAACGRMESARFRVIGVVGPADLSGADGVSARHRVHYGPISVTRE